MDKQQLLDPLIHFLEIESVSTQDKYKKEMGKARHFLTDLFKNLGFETKILKGKRHDAVFAQKLVDESSPTVLIYGHYDVQPPEPLDEWKTPPFKPTVKGDKLYARGSTDMKGQLMIHVMAIKKLLEKEGKPPINVKFIVEGEEEIGSVSVEALAKKYAKSLLSADYLIVSDSQMPEKGQPSIDTSLRGLVYAEVEITSAGHDLHSGQFGGVAENPAIVLARMVSKLKNEDNKIKITGFYDNVVKPSENELSDFKNAKIAKKKLKKEGDLYSIGGGEENYSLNERRWSRPTLDVNGIWSGYTGEGSKTIIPAKASAKISMRLVPNQNPDKIFKLFKKYIKEIAPKSVKITKIKNLAGAYTYKAPTEHSVYSLAKESLKKSFGKKPLFTALGGTIGFVPVVAEAIDAPCLLIGFGLPDENLHAPNENFSIKNYYKGIETMTHFYQNLPSIT